MRSIRAVESNWHGGSLTPATRRAVLAGMLGVAAFASTFSSGFVGDDHRAIEANPAFAQGIGAVLRHDYWGADKTGTWRPLPQASLYADARIWSMRPGGFHLTNAVLHGAVCAMLVLALGAGPAAFAAGLVAAVLAPGGEAVQAIVGRADLLQALFCVLGLWLHRRGSLLASVAFFCALLSKESAVVAPLAYAAFDAFTPSERRTPWPAYLVAAAAYAGLRLAVVGTMMPVVQPQMNPLVLAPPLESVLGAGRVLIERYAWGILDPFRRLYDCSGRECGPAPASDALAWGGLGLALGIVAAPVLLRARQPRAAAGIAWFALFFLPVSNLFVRGPSLYGERLLYVPLLGLAVAAGMAVEWRLAARGAFAALCAFHLSAVQLRNLEWRSDHSLYPTAVDLAPRSARVQANYALVLYDNGDFAAAEEHARRAVSLWPPGTLDSLGTLAASLDGLGRTEEAERTFAAAYLLGSDAILAGQYATFLARHERYESALRVVRAERSRSPADARLRALEQRLVADLGTRSAGR